METELNQFMEAVAQVNVEGDQLTRSSTLSSDSGRERADTRPKQQISKSLDN